MGEIIKYVVEWRNSKSKDCVPTYFTHVRENTGGSQTYCFTEYGVEIKKFDTKEEALKISSNFSIGMVKEVEIDELGGFSVV